MQQKDTPSNPAPPTLLEHLQAVIERMDTERQLLRETITRSEQGTLDRFTLSRLASGAAGLSDDLSELTVTLVLAGGER